MRIRLAAATALPIVVFAISACGDSPTTPPVVNNTPPSIESVTIASAHAEADEDVQVTASVKDAETPINQLTYTWSAAPSNGTFTGSGPALTWRPPKGQTTPDLYTITLTVTENFTSGGQAKQNRVSSSATVHYNDSPAETTALGSQFLADFGTFSVSPEQCVRNFSNNGNCAGEKEAELKQIRDNRVNFYILSSTFTVTPTAFDSGRTSGVMDWPCTFEDIPNSGLNAGRRERVSGICHLTTVYENFKWFLCVSNFNPPYDVTLQSLKGRVPGRVSIVQWAHRPSR